MRCARFAILMLACWSIALRASAAEPDAVPDAATFFELKVRPVLATRCAKCHGADKQSGGLRVDSRAALLAGGDSGPAIVPSEPDASLLVRAVRHQDDRQMPPDETLPALVVDDLASWVRSGAGWPEGAATSDAFAAARHWAFRPRTVVDPPQDPTGRAEQPIDRFIAAGLREHGLSPNAPAEKGVLLRRASFDLVGLPPTPDELAAFLADDSPDAFSKVVERLLASPRYGERWGRHWMDVVRYSDTAGDNADYPVPELHRYRDYIITAFNRDKPYDQFLREQLAGDLLAADGPRECYAERVIATGFVSVSRRYATMPEELWHLTIEDTIDTVGQSFLGLSLRCARCHDHKFDPVTTEDYYALYGIFRSTRYPYAGSEEYQSKNLNRTGFVPLVPPDEAQSHLAVHERQLAALRAAVEQIEKHDPLVATLAQLQERIDAFERAKDEAKENTAQATRGQEELAQVEAQRKRARKELDEKLRAPREALRDAQRSGLPPTLAGAYAVVDAKPQNVAIQRRGAPEDPGAVVPRGGIKFLPGGGELAIPAESSGRRELADWLARGDHPLTARVMANRIWQWHFGRGLVATPSNFGLRGQPPSHPELLDWLAEQFVAGGWSIKAMHRLIMQSKAYQMASTASPAALATDAANTWYWRFDRRRLDAETLRDALLAVGGQLDLSLPGPHPFPPLRDWHWTQHSPFKIAYPSRHRSVYLMTQRLQKNPYLALFDGPDTNYSTAARTEATVPLQALFFLNNALVDEQAQELAARLASLSSDPTARAGAGIRLAWNRAATAAECDEAVARIAQFRAAHVAAGCPQDEVEQASWTSFARVLLSANEFLYVD